MVNHTAFIQYTGRYWREQGFSVCRLWYGVYIDEHDGKIII